MVLKVYWPQDLLDIRSYVGSGDKGAVVLGQKCSEGAEGALVVLNVVQGRSDELVKSGGILGGMSLFEENSQGAGVGIIGSFAGKEKGSGLLRFDFIDGTIQCESAIIIVYEPLIPQMMHFYSLSAIPISLVDNKIYSEVDCRMAELLQESFVDDTASSRQIDYTQILEKLNDCWNQRQLLIEKYPSMPQTWYSLSTYSSIMSKLSDWIYWIFTNHQKAILAPIASIMLYIILGIRHFFLIIIQVLNRRIYNLPSLVEISATAQQIDLRLQQFAYFPIQYIKTAKLTLREATTLNRNLPRKQYPEYIRFYNTLWLILNDIALGVSLSTMILENEENITTFFRETIVLKFLFNDLRDSTTWLMSSPGGIKLNNELSAFLSDLFKWIIEFWKFILVDPFLPYYRHVVLLIAISSSTFGASLAISLFLDISSVMTFHIYCFYYSSAKIFNWLLNVLLSLFYLFWGKKRNVLRKRTDSNDYELDQLLLGTLLFTVVTFLLPTVLAFYVTFAVGELSIMIILATLEISNVMLNHFPIFVLLLRVKDPKRIPGEVQLINYMNYIKISSVPIGLDEMFDHFNNVFNKLKRDYLSKTTLFNIIKGKPIHVERTKLYKLLYSALPSTPISTGQLWGEINDSTPQAEPL